MNVYIIGEKNLFDIEKNSNIEKFGNVIYCENDNIHTYQILRKDLNDKIIVYDPDYAGWNIPDNFISDINNLKAIFLGTTDKSYVNLELCKEKKIEIYSIPKYASDSVAEYLIMFMLSCAKKIPMQIKNNNKQEFTNDFLQVELKNKKVGIVGLGNIGIRIANICYGIGMDVCYWNRNKKQTNYEYVELDYLFSNCDVIFLCLQINDDTQKIISDNLLNKLKRNCIFISCTGKKLFNYSLLEEKINNNELYGYALEDADISLNKYNGNIMVTSEYAWFTKEASELRISKWYQNIIEYLCKINNVSVTKFIDAIDNNKKFDSIYCNIRKANIDDLYEVAKMYEEENWMGESNSVEIMKNNYNIDSKRDILLVAEYNNEIIGTITASINKALAFNCMNYIVFDYLVVKKEYRRKKVGTQLINTLYSIAEKNNIESIWACSSIGRKNAHKFYYYLGFSDSVLGFRKVFINE